MISSEWSLGTLADPLCHQEPLAVPGEDAAVLIEQLRMMVRIRLVERQLATGKRDGAIGGPVHLGVGQEAIAVGVSASLNANDAVFGAHRSHSHVLALGCDVRRLFAEVLGKETGLSKGMGGSMHLWDGPRGFLGSVPIVAGTVPLAVGAAMAARLRGTRGIGVAYFGDGSIEEGVVHESLNLARMTRAPVLFVLENNLFASHMHISLRQPSDATSRFAAANGIPHLLVDGNDVIAVRSAAEKLVREARDGGGPGFLEAVTYRWFGHVDWREDIDVGVHRSGDEVAMWRKRDPIARLAAGLVACGQLAPGGLESIESEVAVEVASAWEQAVADPYPAPEALLDRVFADVGRGK